MDACMEVDGRVGERRGNIYIYIYIYQKGYQHHSVLTICTQTGTCDTRSGDLVFFSAAFDEFSQFTKN